MVRQLTAIMFTDMAGYMRDDPRFDAVLDRVGVPHPAARA